mmetsp:Transcript_10604/g.39963  ORF Transcript_10604/g.39963 Transcript_10604/m.39963 type:complete len:284 (-) Transcript_10604:707-1558(-)
MDCSSSASGSPVDEVSDMHSSRTTAESESTRAGALLGWKRAALTSNGTNSTSSGESRCCTASRVSASSCTRRFSTLSLSLSNSTTSSQRKCRASARMASLASSSKTLPCTSAACSSVQDWTYPLVCIFRISFKAARATRGSTSSTMPTIRSVKRSTKFWSPLSSSIPESRIARMLSTEPRRTALSLSCSSHPMYLVYASEKNLLGSWTIHFCTARTQWRRMSLFTSRNLDEKHSCTTKSTISSCTAAWSDIFSSFCFSVVTFLPSRSLARAESSCRCRSAARF